MRNVGIEINGVSFVKDNLLSGKFNLDRAPEHEHKFLACVLVHQVLLELERRPDDVRLHRLEFLSRNQHLVIVACELWAIQKPAAIGLGYDRNRVIILFFAEQLANRYSETFRQPIFERKLLVKPDVSASCSSVIFIRLLRNLTEFPTPWPSAEFFACIEGRRPF
jgi:hypothetical protein